MTREHKRSEVRLGARTTRNEVRARRLVLIALKDEPTRLKHAREVFCAGFLSPGRVYSLEPDQLLGKRDGINTHSPSSHESGHLPLKVGLRFSLKARMPSR